MSWFATSEANNQVSDKVDAVADDVAKTGTPADSPAPGASGATGESSSQSKKRCHGGSSSGLTPQGKKPSADDPKGDGSVKRSRAEKNKAKREREKAKKLAAQQARGVVGDSVPNKYKIPKKKPAKAPKEAGSTSSGVPERAGQSGVRPTPQDPSASASISRMVTAAATAIVGQASAGTTYADVAANNQNVELEDLTQEALSNITAGQDAIEPKSKRAKLPQIPIYVHSGTELRNPCDLPDFTAVWKRIQKGTISDKKAGMSFKCNVLGFYHREDRGVILCHDEETVAYITERVSTIRLGQKVFRAWRHGTSGTTLVTVFLHDKRLMPPKDIKEAIVIMNDLLPGEIYSFRVSDAPKSTSRLVKFGVRGETLAKLRELDGRIMVGAMNCRMVIAKTNEASESPDSMAASGSNANGEQALKTVSLSQALPAATGLSGGLALNTATTSHAAAAAPDSMELDIEQVLNPTSLSHAEGSTTTEDNLKMDADIDLQSVGNNSPYLQASVEEEAKLLGEDEY